MPDEQPPKDNGAEPVLADKPCPCCGGPVIGRVVPVVETTGPSPGLCWHGYLTCAQKPACVCTSSIGSSTEGKEVVIKRMINSLSRLAAENTAHAATRELEAEHADIIAALTADLSNLLASHANPRSAALGIVRRMLEAGYGKAAPPPAEQTAPNACPDVIAEAHRLLLEFLRQVSHSCTRLAEGAPLPSTISLAAARLADLRATLTALPPVDESSSVFRQAIYVAASLARDADVARHAMRKIGGELQRGWAKGVAAIVKPNECVVVEMTVRIESMEGA